MKIAYIVWNQFQVIQFSNLFGKFHEEKLVVIDRGDNLKLLTRKWLKQFNVEKIIVKQNAIKKLDGAFDVILFQSPFPRMEYFELTKLVSLQYGLAKERHNYGEWRSLADLNLMYGSYSCKQVEFFSPSEMVGNVKFDDLAKDEVISDKDVAKTQLGLDSDKKIVLFMPTWGELGSYEAVRSLIPQFSEYDFILKMHHNNDLRELGWEANASSLGFKKIFNGSSDQIALLKAADVVLSDYSGAIFDAMYMNLPVVLYHANVENLIGIQKFDKDSLEFHRRNEIGVVCTAEDGLKKAIDLAANESYSLVDRYQPLRDELFLSSNNKPSKLIVEAIERLHQGGYPTLTRPQRYVRETVKLQRKLSVQINALKKKHG